MFAGKEAGPGIEDGTARGAEDREEQARVTQGQRKINLIWEYTQAFIAAAVVLANMTVGVHIGLFHNDSTAPVPSVLTNSLFLVVGFYFGRSNHAAVGGIGRKPESPYVGR